MSGNVSLAWGFRGARAPKDTRLESLLLFDGRRRMRDEEILARFPEGGRQERTRQQRPHPGKPTQAIASFARDWRALGGARILSTLEGLESGHDERKTCRQN